MAIETNFKVFNGQLKKNLLLCSMIKVQFFLVHPGFNNMSANFDDFFWSTLLLSKKSFDMILSNIKTNMTERKLAIFRANLVKYCWSGYFHSGIYPFRMKSISD